MQNIITNPFQSSLATVAGVALLTDSDARTTATIKLTNEAMWRIGAVVVPAIAGTYHKDTQPLVVIGAALAISPLSFYAGKKIASLCGFETKIGFWEYVGHSLMGNFILAGFTIADAVLPGKLD